MNKSCHIIIVINLSLNHIFCATQVDLTVFTHGGGLHPSYFSASDFFSLLHEQVDKSLYAKTTDLLRHDPFFFQVQPMDYPGLRRAYPVEHIEHGSHIFALFYDRVYHLIEKNPRKTVYYAFGWEALLDNKVRVKAGKRLYLELASKIDALKRYGYTPYVRVLGYSHGGNVSLNIAEHARNFPPTFLKQIDELILISTPIQSGAQELALSKLFKHVYLFYSTGDNVQATDFISSPRHTFSRRTLPKQKNCSPTCKITQIQVRLANKVIPTRSAKGKRTNISDYQMINPSHCEMFFFGWTPEWYRKYLPIRPLSVGMLIPIILKYIKVFHLQGHQLRATIVPYKEQIILLDKDTDKTYTVPFLTHKQLHTLQQDLWRYRPRGFDDSTKFRDFYHNQMRATLKKVRKLDKTQRKHACLTCKSRARKKSRRLHSAM